ncbi:MAG: type IV pilus twitching motility protein PilT [Candidatus Omnitrophica bacterium]|nr:type IV pilus twitching motility protein PilT [Candidatus Omnitrophota bacterium]
MATKTKEDLDFLLKALVEKDGSDLHLQANSSPIFRIYGQLVSSGSDVVTSKDIEEFTFSIMHPEQKEAFSKTKHVDFSYSIEGVGRFRVNVFRQRGNVGSVMRAIPVKIATMEQLGLPQVAKDLAAKPNGLVLVTGPTGSGKTTTLASIIDHINDTQKGHIITIEDPIEFIHVNKSCVINQRELHLDTESFSAALKDALREDPDVILVGEMRDLETISLAITAAETGHLVFATLHTNSAPQTIDRIIDVFPPHQQQQIRTQLAGALRGVIAQTLLRKADASGRIAAFEVMVGNAPIRALINDGKTNQIYSTMQVGRNDGMQTMDSALIKMVQDGLVFQEEASIKVFDRSSFDLAVKKK